MWSSRWPTSRLAEASAWHYASSRWSPLGGGVYSTPEHSGDEPGKELPPLPVEVLGAIQLIPRSLAVDFGVFPVKGRPPIQDEFREECGHVRLLCLTRPTD